MAKLPLQFTDLQYIDPDKYLAEQTQYFKRVYLAERVHIVVDSLRANGSRLKTVFEEAYAMLTREGHTIQSGNTVRRIYYGIYFAKQSKNHPHK